MISCGLSAAVVQQGDPGHAALPGYIRSSDDETIGTVPGVRGTRTPSGTLTTGLPCGILLHLLDAVPVLPEDPAYRIRPVVIAHRRERAYLLFPDRCEPGVVRDQVFSAPDPSRGVPSEALMVIV
jgi:hypothetical protein